VKTYSREEIERFARETLDMYLERIGSHGDHDRAKDEALVELREGLDAMEESSETLAKLAEELKQMGLNCITTDGTEYGGTYKGHHWQIMLACNMWHCYQDGRHFWGRDSLTEIVRGLQNHSP